MADEVASVEAPAAVAANPLDQLVERYVQLRDKRDQMEAEHKKRKAQFNDALKRIENFLLGHLNNCNAESVRTQAGTFFKSMQVSATVADWDAMWGWIQQDLESRASALEKRVSKSFVEAYEAEYHDFPPGVNVRKEVVVNVRRA